MSLKADLDSARQIPTRCYQTKDDVGRVEQEGDYYAFLFGNVSPLP